MQLNIYQGQNLRVEHRRLSSVTLSGVPLYPGIYRFVWVELLKGTWFLVSIEQVES